VDANGHLVAIARDHLASRFLKAFVHMELQLPSRYTLFHNQSHVAFRAQREKRPEVDFIIPPLLTAIFRERNLNVECFLKELNE
jgi:hypothetical protein